MIQAPGHPAIDGWVANLAHDHNGWFLNKHHPIALHA
jgi:hypothetical protein